MSIAAPRRERLSEGPAKSGAADKRSGAIAKAQQKFAAAFAKAKGSACPTTATAESAETAVDSASGSILFDLLASPAAGSGTFITIDGAQTTYDGRTYTPVCMDGSPYKFFVQRGTVNKLVMYYQGGGACWEQLTCSIPTCDDNVTGGSDNPNNSTTGFGDLSIPPTRSRTGTSSSCRTAAGDIHFGDSRKTTRTRRRRTAHIEHRG